MEYHAKSKFMDDMRGLRKAVINYTLPILISLYLPSSIGTHYEGSETLDMPAEIPEVLMPKNQLEEEFL